MPLDSDSDLETFPSLYLKWRVDARNKSDTFTFSSEFSFQGKQCRLAFRVFEINTHQLALQNLSGGCDEPLDVVVEVENGTGQILPELKFQRHFENPKFPEIWRKSENDVVRAYPEFCRNNHELRFRVLLTADVKDTDLVATPAEPSVPVNELSCLKHLSEDLAQLMIQDSGTDVEFQCGDDSTMAHRSIVCSRSPVLASMLSTDMVEGRTGVVRIPNMEPDIFRRLLKYLYTGTLDELTFSVALSLYEAGDQYAVRGLAKRCSGFLLEHLHAENACDLLLAADAHSDDVFKEAVIRFMVDRKVPQVYSGWLQFCSGHSGLAVEVLNRMCNVVSK